MEGTRLISGRHCDDRAVLSSARWKLVADDPESSDHIGVVLETVVDQLQTEKLFEERRPKCGRLIVSYREMGRSLSRLNVDEDGVWVARA